MPADALALLRRAVLLGLPAMAFLAERAAAQGHDLSLTGAAPGDQFGRAVDFAGDVDADGFTDVVVGAWLHAANAAESGMVRVHSGKTGFILHTFLGDANPGHLGLAVSGAGDVDADGFADVIAGAHRGGPMKEGYARLWSGRTGVEIRTHVGSSPFDDFGYSVDEAGDLDGDGFDDVVVGAELFKAPGFEAGLTRTFSGKTGAMIHDLHGSAGSSWFGFAVSGGGDVNADGFVDFLGSAVHAHANGTLAGAVRVHSGTDGSLIHAIPGLPHETLGFGASLVGDVNADGFVDVAAGAPANSFAAVEGGRLAVFSGKDASVLHSVFGDEHAMHMGTDVAAAGDLDGDGFDDVIVGTPAGDVAGIDSGMVRVHSGKDGSVLRTYTNHQEILTDFGQSVGGRGDVNADGVPDVIVGAPQDDTVAVDAGRAWVFSGACADAAVVGFADAGSGGFEPRLRAHGGLPALGNSLYGLTIDRALGGAPCVLFIGVARAQIGATWGTFFIDPTQPYGAIPLVLGGAPGVPGAGVIKVATPIPTSMQLVGFKGIVQALIGDAGSGGGIAHTNAVSLTVCK